MRKPNRQLLGLVGARDCLVATRVWLAGGQQVRRTADLASHRARGREAAVRGAHPTTSTFSSRLGTSSRAPSRQHRLQHKTPESRTIRVDQPQRLRQQWQRAVKPFLPGETSGRSCTCSSRCRKAVQGARQAPHGEAGLPCACHAPCMGRPPPQHPRIPAAPASFVARPFFGRAVLPSPNADGSQSMRRP